MLFLVYYILTKQERLQKNSLWSISITTQDQIDFEIFQMRNGQHNQIIKFRKKQILKSKQIVTISHYDVNWSMIIGSYLIIINSYNIYIIQSKEW